MNDVPLTRSDLTALARADTAEVRSEIRAFGIRVEAIAAMLEGLVQDMHRRHAELKAYLTRLATAMAEGSRADLRAIDDLNAQLVDSALHHSR